jgi:phosphonate transport system substrate-binding protein
MWKQIRNVLGVVLVVLLTFTSVARAEQKKFTLAVVPQARSVEIIEKWTPFVKRLSQELGAEIEILPFNSIPEFEAAVLKGVPDLAYLNPYQAVLANGKGYVPLVRDKNPLVGILVVHKGGKIASVKDLNGKAIAFPAPNAFAASLYMRALLTEKEKINFTPEYVKTHSNVYRSVTFDRTAAGGGVTMTLNKEPEDIKRNLTILYETPGTPSHPLVASPRVPETVRKKVAQAVLSLASSPTNKIMFMNIQMPDPVEADFQRDYLPLKKLGVEKYVGKEMD